ncbi:MAG: hypothetical protein C0404_11145 [Verrucomicrobia bacterium]|nr:hypothetical protein [Verrucomicrobiota bacterium]
MAEAVIEGLSDTDLVKAYCSDGDKGAFDQIYKRYLGLVYAISFRILRDDSDAEDACVACFVLFTKKASKLAGRVNLGSWFYWCASHIASNQRRVRSRRLVHEKEAFEMTMRESEGTAQDFHSVLPTIETAIAQLPESQRQVVVMMYYQGMSKTQIAAQLKCPEGTVASWLGRALERIRKSLRRDGRDLSLDELAAGFSQTALLVPVPQAVTMKLGALAAGGAVAANVTALVQDALASILIAKVKTALVVASAVVVVGGGAVTAYGVIKAGPRIIYDDDFRKEQLSEFWVKATPEDRVSYGQGRLDLQARGDAASSSSTHILSRKVELAGKSLEIFIKRGSLSELPAGSSMEISLHDQGEQEFARMWVSGFARNNGATDAVVRGRIGQGNAVNYLGGGQPSEVRMYVDPSGKVFFGKTRAEIDKGVIYSSGMAGKHITAVSIKIETVAPAGLSCRQGYEHITVSRLDVLPGTLQALDFAQKTGK